MPTAAGTPPVGPVLRPGGRPRGATPPVRRPVTQLGDGASRRVNTRAATPPPRPAGAAGRAARSQLQPSLSTPKASKRRGNVFGGLPATPSECTPVQGGRDAPTPPRTQVLRGVTPPPPPRGEIRCDAAVGRGGDPALMAARARLRSLEVAAERAGASASEWAEACSAAAAAAAELGLDCAEGRGPAETLAANLEAVANLAAVAETRRAEAERAAAASAVRLGSLREAAAAADAEAAGHGGTPRDEGATASAGVAALQRRLRAARAALEEAERARDAARGAAAAASAEASIAEREHRNAARGEEEAAQRVDSARAGITQLRGQLSRRRRRDALAAAAAAVAARLCAESYLVALVRSAPASRPGAPPPPLRIATTCGRAGTVVACDWEGAARSALFDCDAVAHSAHRAACLAAPAPGEATAVVIHVRVPPAAEERAVGEGTLCPELAARILATGALPLSLQCFEPRPDSGGVTDLLCSSSAGSGGVAVGGPQLCRTLEITEPAAARRAAGAAVLRREGDAAFWVISAPGRPGPAAVVAELQPDAACRMAAHPVHPLSRSRSRSPSDGGVAFFEPGSRVEIHSLTGSAYVALNGCVGTVIGPSQKYPGRFVIGGVKKEPLPFLAANLRPIVAAPGARRPGRAQRQQTGGAQLRRLLGEVLGGGMRRTACVVADVWQGGNDAEAVLLTLRAAVLLRRSGWVDERLCTGVA
eukprot:TRINITY_DN13193_c0_g3_i1.p1 TRINITY_DN13193_c0_g3~~TRINITY_DN13193_c0_g3_i1.p1  ORF type:complete len:707 (+),score=163.99 TRINITY_DN13193_c0_g3_i1:80-2200(+)